MDKTKSSSMQGCQPAEASSSASELTKSGKDTPVAAAKVNDPQVKAKRHYTPRRSFSAAYKERILIAYDACANAAERGALLRREGLYHSRICAWKSARSDGKLNKSKKGKQATRTDHLTRENEQLKKKLAQAAAIIELQKKVSDLLGTHILPHEKNEEN